MPLAAVANPDVSAVITSAAAVVMPAAAVNGTEARDPAVWATWVTVVMPEQG